MWCCVQGFSGFHVSQSAICTFAACGPCGAASATAAAALMVACAAQRRLSATPTTSGCVRATSTMQWSQFLVATCSGQVQEEDIPARRRGRRPREEVEDFVEVCHIPMILRISSASFWYCRDELQSQLQLGQVTAWLDLL